MKMRPCFTCILLYFALFFLPLLTTAQSSVAWPTDSTTWIETENSYSFGQLNWSHKNYYRMNGDTLINGQSYTNLTVRRAFIFYGSGSYGPEVHFAAIRSDSNRVWIWSDTLQQDLILYDFTLAVGDTFVRYNTNSQNSPGYKGIGLISRIAIVSKIDTVIISGVPRRVWEFGFDGSYPSTVVEGIGYMSSIANPWLEHAGLDWNHYLECYTQRGQLPLQGYPFYLENCLLTSRDEAANPVGDILIGPNPARGQFQISTPRPGPMEAMLYDLQGRLLYAGKSSSGKMKITTHNFPPGLIMLKVITPQGIHQEKILIPED